MDLGKPLAALINHLSEQSAAYVIVIALLMGTGGLSVLWGQTWLRSEIDARVDHKLTDLNTRLGKIEALTKEQQRTILGTEIRQMQRLLCSAGNQDREAVQRQLDTLRDRYRAVTGDYPPEYSCTTLLGT